MVHGPEVRWPIHWSSVIKQGGTSVVFLDETIWRVVMMEMWELRWVSRVRGFEERPECWRGAARQAIEVFNSLHLLCHPLLLLLYHLLLIRATMHGD